MRGKPRIVLYRRLGASVSVALACCIFHAGAQAANVYSYPSPDDADDSGSSSPHAGKGAAPAAAQDYHVLADSPYAARREARLRGSADPDGDGWTHERESEPESTSSAATPVPKLLIAQQPPAAPRSVEIMPAPVTASMTTPPAPLPPAPQPAYAYLPTPSAAPAPTAPDAKPVPQVSATSPPPQPRLTLPAPAATGSFAVPVVSAVQPAYTFRPPAAAIAPEPVATAAPPAAAPPPPLQPAPAVQPSYVLSAPVTLAAKPVSLPPPVSTAAPLPPAVTVGFAPVVASDNAAAATPPLPPAEATAQNLALLAPASGVLPLQPQPDLSQQSKQIADTLPPEKPLAKKPPVTLDRMHKNPLESETEVQEHEGVGIRISVKRPKADVARMLDDAYHSLVSGDQEDAIALYKQVLEAQPTNKLALLGLATTYHRAGQLQLARPLYGKLLALDPHSMEGLNNFLVLLADESPQGALRELTQLQQTHPTFSPIPAQMAVIYEKMGDYPKATQAMTHAIELSPENLKYRYDMAIILDKQGDWPSASLFYQQLLSASERGEKIPTDAEEIQKRLTFIRSNRPST